MEKKSLATNDSAEDMAKQFQAYLRKYEKDDKLVILEVASEPGTKPGDNYTSVLTRTKLVGRRGDGSPYIKRFMRKTLSKGRAITGLMDVTDLFRMEVHAYRKILPILGSFGPRCLHAEEDIIILEDLAEKGYVNYERRNFLDLDHSVFALKKLAKLHAVALSIKIKDPQLYNELHEPLEEIIYKKTAKAMRMCTEMSIKSVVKYLEMIEPRTQELQAVIDHIGTYVDKTYDTMLRLFTGPKQKYYTFCHGDPWVNNLLYLYDNDGRIIDLKMVDFQICRHISVSTDIHYFIYSSVQSSVIERSYESLIKIYHNEFLNELRRLHVDEKYLTELGTEWLETEMRTFSFYGAIIGCFLVNPIFAEEEEAIQFESIEFGPMNPLYSADTTVKVDQRRLDRIKCVTSHYYRRYSLGIINDDIEPISIAK